MNDGTKSLIVNTVKIPSAIVTISKILIVKPKFKEFTKLCGFLQYIPFACIVSGTCMGRFHKGSKLPTCTGFVGRGKLELLLSLGQGEVKTLINRLKRGGFIVILERGCKLTEKGKREYEKLSNQVPWTSPVDGKSLGIGRYTCASIIRGKSKKVRLGIEQ